jgi:hypothetical protein
VGGNVGRMGVWAYGRVGVWASGRDRRGRLFLNPFSDEETKAGLLFGRSVWPLSSGCLSRKLSMITKIALRRLRDELLQVTYR